MITHFVKITAFCLINGALILAGCTSSDSGGGGGLTVPANAVTITPTNAKTTVTTAIASADIALSALGAEVVQAPSAMDIVNLIEEIRINRSATSTLNMPTGITDSYLCTDGGSASYTYNETTTSDSGTVTFSNCTQFGVTLNGTLTYSSTWTNPYGAYSDHMSGNITATVSNSVTTISNLNFTDSGVENEFGDYAYTINPFSYSIDFTGGGGFTVSLLAPVTGDDAVDPVCPSTGIILVTGAGSTRAKATIDYPLVDIEFDDGSGSFVPVESANCNEVFP